MKLQIPKTELPLYSVYAYRVLDRGRNVWLLSFYCPRCRRMHTHGGGTDERPSLGHKAEHCTDPSFHPHGYELVEPVLVPTLCEKGHRYSEGNVLVTKGGLHCKSCEPNIRDARTAVPLPAVPELTEQQRKRFLSKVITDEATGCQYRRGVSRGRHGGTHGGNVKLYPATVPAHRVALKIAGRPEPDGHKAVPECGDEHCINPEHRRFVPR